TIRSAPDRLTSPRTTSNAGRLPWMSLRTAMRIRGGDYRVDFRRVNDGIRPPRPPRRSARRGLERETVCCQPVTNDSHLGRQALPLLTVSSHHFAQEELECLRRQRRHDRDPFSTCSRPTGGCAACP